MTKPFLVFFRSVSMYVRSGTTCLYTQTWWNVRLCFSRTPFIVPEILVFLDIFSQSLRLQVPDLVHSEPLRSHWVSRGAPFIVLLARHKNVANRCFPSPEFDASEILTVHWFVWMCIFIVYLLFLQCTKRGGTSSSSNSVRILAHWFFKGSDFRLQVRYTLSPFYYSPLT